MIVTYQGEESFRISQGDFSLAVNPATSRAGANITLISSKAFASDGKGFVIDGPGEYEIEGVSVKGFLSETGHGGAKLNTVYTISIDNMNLAFLGALSNPALSPDATEAMEDIDILFAPIGGAGTLDPAAAYKLAVSLEPRVIVPMHYTKEALNLFLKEGGEDKLETLDKLVVKKKDLDGKEGEIIVIKEE